MRKITAGALVTAAVVGTGALMGVGVWQMKTSGEISISEEGVWSCPITHSNGFGTCLDDLATRLEITAAPTLDKGKACRMANLFGGANEIWLPQTEQVDSGNRQAALETAEYRSSLELEGDWKQGSPARAVMQMAGVEYVPSKLNYDTMQANLETLRQSPESLDAIETYISSTDVKGEVNHFYYAKPESEGTLQEVMVRGDGEIIFGSQYLEGEDFTKANGAVSTPCDA